MSRDPRKILVRGVNWLGDAVMTTPAMMRLRERFPHAEITLLTPEKLGSIYLDHPAVDRVLMTARQDSVLTVASWLRGEQFDLGVIFPNSPRSALELFLARIPQRVGYARALRTWMLTHAVTDRAGIPRMRKRTPAEVRARVAGGAARESYDRSGHHVLQYLHLTAALGCNPEPLCPTLRVSEAAQAAVAVRFGLSGEGPLLGLNPGAEYGPAKRWPAERFVQAAVDLHGRTGCRWVIFGGAADQTLAAEITSALDQRLGRGKVVNVAGKTTLRELCAALNLCRLLLTNDTGPMHVAAALGTPVVVPFGSTSPELTGPGLPWASDNALFCGEAPCAPCFLRECPIDFRCMTSISPDQVVSAAVRILQMDGRHA